MYYTRYLSRRVQGETRLSRHRCISLSLSPSLSLTHSLSPQISIYHPFTRCVIINSLLDFNQFTVFWSWVQVRTSMVSMVQLVNRRSRIRGSVHDSTRSHCQLQLRERVCSAAVLLVGFCAAASGRRLRYMCICACARARACMWGVRDRGGWERACVVERDKKERRETAEDSSARRGRRGVFLKVARRKTSLTSKLASLFDLSELRDPHIFRPFLRDGAAAWWRNFCLVNGGGEGALHLGILGDTGW